MGYEELQNSTTLGAVLPVKNITISNIKFWDTDTKIKKPKQPPNPPLSKKNPFSSLINPLGSSDAGLAIVVKSG